MIEIELKIDLEDSVSLQLENVAVEVWRKTFEKGLQRVEYPPYMDFKTAAKYLSVSVDILRRLIREYHLPVIHLEGTTIRKISKTSLDQWMKEREK